MSPVAWSACVEGFGVIGSVGVLLYAFSSQTVARDTKSLADDASCICAVVLAVVVCTGNLVGDAKGTGAINLVVSMGMSI